MKTIITTVLLSILFIAHAESQELPKVKIAVVNLQRISMSGINSDKIRLLSLDKATLRALNKINTEIQEVQTQIVDVNDEITLADLGRRLSFLQQKSMMLRQRTMNSESSRDIQGLIRRFVIDKFKDKYSLIIQQQDTGNADRVISKAGNVEVEDITDDVRDEFYKYLEHAGDESTQPAKSSPPAIVN
jgi:hypothetical protein